MKTFIFSCVVLAVAVSARGQALDPLLTGSNPWQTRPDDFMQQNEGSGFYWLAASHDRAGTHSRNVTLFGKPVYEVDADFQQGKLSGLTFSIYNRGDAGDMDKDQLTALVAQTVQRMNELTKASPVVEGREASDAVNAYAISWRTAASKYLLEYSFTREVKSRSIPFRAEFVRLHVTPVEKPKTFLAEALASAAPIQTQFDGPAHVQKDASGDVRIATVPMVDQGEKGYCVVATAERVMRYYGVPVDEHELAELANSSATQGTSNEAMFESLKKLSQRLRVKIRPVEQMDVRQLLALMSEYNRRARREHAPEIPQQGPMLDIQTIYSAMKPDLLKQARTHNKAEVDRFLQMVRDHIDQGVPVLWSVMLGVVPETMAPRGMGGHMRLIIGYNLDTNEILYSDSWGPGHESKRMSADDAWTMTLAMNTIEPL